MHQSQAEASFQGLYATLGFVEALEAGQRLLGHSGALRGLASSLDLVPEHQQGYCPDPCS
jgi:hypothetical protein